MKSQTLNRILKHLKLEFSEWVRRPSAKKYFFEEPHQWFEDYLQGTSNAKWVMDACDHLSKWYVNLYENQGLNQEVTSKNDFAKWAYYAFYAFQFHYHLKPEYPNNPPVMTMYQLGPRLASSLFMNDADKANLVLKQTLSLMLNEKHSTYTRHVWFMLHILCDWQDIELNPEQFSYPDSIQPYDQVLVNWRTSNLSEVDRLVFVLADFHIEQAYEMTDDEVPEFDMREWWVLPYEILSWLRLREWVGLDNPAEFSHPLMRLTQNQLPSELKRPDMPELDRIIKKFRKEFP